MILFKIDECDDFDHLGVRANKDYNELHFILKGRMLHRERWLRGLFNEYHFKDDLRELGVDISIINNILNFYRTYGKRN